MSGSHFVADLATVLGVGAVTSVLARLAKQSSILGYLTAGLIVGPYLPVPIFADEGRVAAMAEFGVVLVMFSIGLEFRLSKLARVLPTSGFSGLVQIAALLWGGASLGIALGWNSVEALFLGGAICISSTMVVTSAFAQRPPEDDVRDHILGILVFQDVAAIALMAAMTAVAAGGELTVGEMGRTLGMLGLTLLAMIAGGLLLVPPLVRAVARLESPETSTVAATGLCFAMALLAEHAGYSVALGAFIAGILVAESGRGHPTEHRIAPIRDMFAAIFFVSVGMTVDPRLALEHLPTSLVVTLFVLVAQVASVTLGGVLSGNGVRRSLSAGLALGQIGEFAFIIGGIGLTAGVARPELQPILVTVAVLTSFTTPLALGVAPRAVSWLDRTIPGPTRRFLSLYEEWVERFVVGGSAPGPIRRALRAIILDGTVLIVLAALLAYGFGRAEAWLVEHGGALGERANAVVVAGALLVALPFAVGLVRNSVALGRLAEKTLVPPGAPVRPAVGRAMRTMVYACIGVGLVLPSMAVLRPVFARPAVGLVAVLLASLAVVVVWRSRQGLEGDFLSGAQRIARALAPAEGPSEPGPAESTRLSNPALLPGLDAVARVELGPKSQAVGQTLADIDLRARTGATVVAIYRSGDRVVLPTGREELGAGDVLAITGTASALEAATRVLLRGGDQ